MTILNKILATLCGILALACVVLVLQNASKASRIADMQHAAELSAVRIESMAETERFKDALLREGHRNRTTLQAEIDSLSKLIPPHGKPRPRPTTVPAIRDSILSAARTR
jgi:hypothetical protein